MTFDFRLGLTGHPLGHSLSPKIHAAALAACGLTGDYSLFPIHPEDKPALAALLNRLRAGELHGLNVTIPHKQNVIPLLDGLTETAKAIGAVNTISLRNGQLIGDNTDAPGFLSDLNNFLNGQKSKVESHKSAIVLGAGGSARAVVYALANDGWTVTLAARRIEQAQQLAASFPNYQLPITSFSDLQPLTLDLLVNTTPLGMTPNIDTTPWELPFPENAAVYDLVYNPRETRLVREARAAGPPATTGLGMLIEQAALAFEIWTGKNPPREILWQAVESGK
jgi:shikimate dehydrogenase